ncbi:MAG: glycosyltransferase family 2 protein [Planctomycetes bacterium]|nr:glycosyltransferase family 2 protein [Planctomycetota bacterium]
MQCSVVIPCHNGADLTRRCLASLVAPPARLPAEIVLVDNGSRDDTADLAGLHPTIRVLRLPTNRGFAGGVNAGIRASHGDVVLVLNNDTQAAANLLDELLRRLLASPSIGAVAPVSNHVKGPARLPVGDAGRSADGRAAIAAALAATPPLQDVDTLAGLCLLVRRTTLDRVGLFDERFGHGNYEDDDLCLRLRLHGYRLAIARHAFLHHEGHATFRALGIDLGTELQRRQAQFVAKWRGDPAGRATIAAWRGDLAAAAAAAAEAARIWPLWPDADWHLARWHQANGDRRRAAGCLRRLLEHGPRHSEAAAALAGLLLATDDDPPSTTHYLDRLVRDFPLAPAQQAQLLHDLGVRDFQAGRFGAAREHFLAAGDLLPSATGLQPWLQRCDSALAGTGAAAASTAVLDPDRGEPDPPAPASAPAPAAVSWRAPGRTPR